MIDADALALVRVVELRAAGVDAKPLLLWSTVESRTIYRVVVRLPDGTIEEPQ